MELDFSAFAKAVHDAWNKMSKGELFVVGDNAEVRENIFNAYLAAWPEGSNPIYKTRTEHDCVCCKQFVRNIGRVIDAEGHSVWAYAARNLGPGPHRTVALAMRHYVAELPITGLYRSTEPAYGNEFTRQQLDDGTIKKWGHFCGKNGTKFFTQKADEQRGEAFTAVQVFERGLKELTPGALQTVLDLIDDNALYRGSEHRAAVAGFQNLQRAYKAGLLDLGHLRNNWLWIEGTANGLARFRNTVIGTLVQDLSSGVDTDAAVRAFETKVAPANYKRPTAVITKRMVDDAMKQIDALGLESSLHRRLAHLSDVSIADVLWVDRATTSKLKGGLKGLLLDTVKDDAPKKSDAEEIHIDAFMSKVLPKATSMQVYLQNQHLTNFVTLTAPEGESTGKLFKWANDFGWSYDGNVTDSIREKVKRAGGNVDAKLRFSLAWHNFDDLDLHVTDPFGERICFYAKRGRHGFLDVDMNAGSGRTREPVENVAFASPPDGKYLVEVNQYSRRETADAGFSIEIAHAGGVVNLSCAKSPANTGTMRVAQLQVKGGVIVEATYGLTMVASSMPQTKWGLSTEKFVPVETVMYSPNYWGDSGTGNRHYIFALQGCKVDEPQRGIYNEFLALGLEKHRKVFEVLGNKTKCEPTNEQISGLGFSSTRGDTVTVSVTTEKATRLYAINF